MQYGLAPNDHEVFKGRDAGRRGRRSSGFAAPPPLRRRASPWTLPSRAQCPASSWMPATERCWLTSWKPTAVGHPPLVDAGIKAYP